MTDSARFDPFWMLRAPLSGDVAQRITAGVVLLTILTAFAGAATIVGGLMLVFGAVGVILWIGGHDVLTGRITAGQLSAFVFYAIVVAGSVGAILLFLSVPCGAYLQCCKSSVGRGRPLRGAGPPIPLARLARREKRGFTPLGI